MLSSIPGYAWGVWLFSVSLILFSALSIGRLVSVVSSALALFVTVPLNAVFTETGGSAGGKIAVATTIIAMAMVIASSLYMAVNAYLQREKKIPPL